VNYNYMIIYQKYNGELLYRAVKTRPGYSKGDKTSMGWKVIDILRLYNGKCYSTYEYDTLLSKKNKIYKSINIINKIDIIKLIEFLIVVYFFVFLCKM